MTPTPASKIAKERPRLDVRTARQIAQKLIIGDLGARGLDLIARSPTLILGVRGYYEDSLGRPRMNDYGIFDDAAFVLPPTDGRAFNFNVDPSTTGWNEGVDKFYAQLTEGVYVFRQGPHHPGKPNEVPLAFRQLTEAEARSHRLERYFGDADPRALGKFRVRRVERDRGIPEGEIEWGLQNINIHPGGPSGTSSWGCQTVPREQWPEFQRYAYECMADHDQGQLVAYVLCSSRYAL